MSKPCVLVFAGLDPSGGAGIQADIQAIGASGAHPLPVVTALTVQDNQRVYAVHPVDATLLREQVRVLVERGTRIDAIKIGIVGSTANATAIAAAIGQLRQRHAALPVVLDPVLASGQGDLLTRDDAVQALAPLRRLATLITPNLPEARALCGVDGAQAQANLLLQDVAHVLIKGGHGSGDTVVNQWFSAVAQRSWSWPRLTGDYHGSGCTLAAAIAAGLARQYDMESAIDGAQTYTQHSLARAFSIAEGQMIPDRLGGMQ